MASFLQSLQDEMGRGGGGGLNTLLPQQQAPVAPAIDYNTVRNPYGTWQTDYAKTNKGAAYSPDSKITQTKDQFLQKYASAIGSNGKFIPGKANLWFDDEDAGTVYDTMIGRQAGAVRHFGNPRDGYNVTDPDTFNSEVNMDWVDDPRPGGGWASVKDVVLPGIATLAAIYGGQALLGAGGGGATAAGGGFSASGSALPSLGTLGTAAPSLTGGAVGAGDLALTAMPEVTAASMGLGEATAGAGSLASLGGSTGELSSLSNLGTGLSDIGYVDGSQSVLAGAQPSMSMGQAMGAGTDLAGTLGGATNAAGNLIGTGTAAGGYTANFLNSPAGQLLNSLGGDSLVSMGNTVAGGLSTAQAGSTLLDKLSTGAGAIGSLISANNAGNTNANNQNAITNQMNTLSSMYSQDSPYAKMLKQQLERKDAAAGRNSQYGNRLTQLQAMLADKAAGVASTVGNLSLQSNQINNAQTANQNTQLNALGQLSNATGVTDWTKNWLNNGLNSLFGG
jgi:hypothetical protein